MRLRKRSLFVLLIGFFITALGAIIPCIVLKYYESSNSAVGIIGGADKPTYLFLLLNAIHSLPFCLILWGMSLMLAATFCLFFSKTIQTHCYRKTTSLSLAISSVAGLGLLCGFLFYTFATFGEKYKHPIAYPASILLGATCLVSMIILVWLYCKRRPSVCGIILDLATAVWFLPSFFYLWAFAYSLLER